MGNLDKKFLITINLRDSSVTVSNESMKFYNTDKNIANLYIKINDDLDGFTKYVPKSDSSKYQVKITVIKPKTKMFREIIGIPSDDLKSETCAIYKFELPNEFTDQEGDVYCEPSIISGDEELTADYFKYIVKSSKLIGLNEEIQRDPDLSILKGIMQDVKLTMSELTKEVQKVNYIDNENITDTNTYSNRKIEEKFDGVNAQFNTIEQDVNSQMLLKATKGEIVSSDLKILNESDRLGLANLKQEVIQSMAGTTAVNQTPADYSVTPSKTSFFRTGKNLFDKNSVISNKGVNQESGELFDYAGYSASEFIKVLPSTDYTRQGVERIAFYDINKVYITGYIVGALGKTFTTPSNCHYIRDTIANTVLSIYQIEEGGVETSYEGYYNCLDVEKTIKEKSITVSMLSNEVFTTINNIPSITLPPTINALVGKEINIYFDNIVDSDYKKYDFSVICDIGKQQNDRWTCTTTNAGIYTITIEMYQNGVFVASAISSVIVKAITVGNTINKTLLVIGDSTTDAGAYTYELLSLFNADNMDITLLGSRGDGGTNRHEGRSGWSTLMYTTLATSGGVANAFYNNGFDFSYYMTQQGYANVDYVSINLGINDTFIYTDDASLNAEINNILTRYQTIIDSIKAYNSNIKIGVAITIPPSYYQDAFGASYNCSQTRWRYKRNNYIWITALINQFRDKDEEGIYLVPININLDTINNMNVETVAINSRNATQISRQNNGVHPAGSGYSQIADIFYYWLKSFES